MNIQLDDIRDDIRQQVRTALEEDIGSGDITAMLIPEDAINTATIITREPCIVCGTAWLDECFQQLGGIEQIEWHVKDGDHAKANATLVTLKGNARALLTGERTALNFLQMLSGIATNARRYADAVAGSQIRVLDTRKTIPGLRTAQKYAITVGGCHNHRIGLYDAFLIKENHITACGSIAQAVTNARNIAPGKPVEVETETLDELKQAIAAGADIAMLDNFSETMLQAAIALEHPKTKYEVSGNLDLAALKALTDYTIDYCSFGALTKHVQAIDLSMRVQS